MQDVLIESEQPLSQGVVEADLVLLVDRGSTSYRSAIMKALRPSKVLSISPQFQNPIACRVCKTISERYY